jgi:diguanylate cyclase (GGDEF)-like protein/PAS domain S-box-containing protein
MLSRMSKTQVVLGVFISTLGALVAAGWIFHLRALVLPHAQLGHIVFPPALFFILAGLWLIARQGAKPPGRWFDFLIGGFIGLWSVGTLIQFLFGVDLGIDLAFLHTWLTVDGAHRMAPNSALAFLLAGMVICAAGRSSAGPMRTVTYIAIYTLIGLAITGLLGHVLQLEWLYWWFSASRMAVPTAVGLGALGVALWLQVRRPIETDGEGEITLFTIVLVISIALICALAGFALLKSGMEETMTAKLEQTAAMRSELFRAHVVHAHSLALAAATHPGLLEAAQRVQEAPADWQARWSLNESAEGFLPVGLSYLRVYGRAGTPMTGAGLPVAEEALQVPVRIGDYGAELIWADGFILRSRLPLIKRGTPLGHLIAESRLPTLDEVFFHSADMGRTGELKLCGRREQTLDCFPSRLVPKVHRFPFFDARGAPSYPVSRAILGQRGIEKVRDFRGTRVFAAYEPVGSTSLGLVAKFDADELYDPLAGRVVPMLALPLALLLIGIVLVRSRIAPLAHRLVVSEKSARAHSEKLAKAMEELKRSEERARAVIDNAYECYIAIDAKDRVIDWNPEATVTFGWTKEEAMGRELAELIIPPAYREDHHRGMKHYLETGEGPVLDKRIEVSGCHKDGRELPVELSIRAIGTGDHAWFSCFLRDITARKHAEQEWRLREKLMLELADAVPSWVAYIDSKERYRYCNRPYLEALGMKQHEIEFKTLLEVLGPETYALIEPHVNEVLSGRVVSFERPMRTAKGMLTVEARYVPDQVADGRVRGFYVMLWDVTEHLQKQKQLLRRASIDNLTGLLNRSALLEALEAANEKAAAGGDAFALLFLDIDRFKGINDTRGHAVGDEVLIEFARRLRGVVRATDLVARFGGDEFVVLLPDAPQCEAVVRIAEDIITTINERMQVTGGELAVSTSVGVAYVKRFDRSTKELLNAADEALYEAKGAGRNRYVLRVVE